MRTSLFIFYAIMTILVPGLSFAQEAGPMAAAGGLEFAESYSGTVNVTVATGGVLKMTLFNGPVALRIYEQLEKAEGVQRFNSKNIDGEIAGEVLQKGPLFCSKMINFDNVTCELNIAPNGDLLVPQFSK